MSRTKRGICCERLKIYCVLILKSDSETSQLVEAIQFLVGELIEVDTSSSLRLCFGFSCPLDNVMRFREI